MIPLISSDAAQGLAANGLAQIVEGTWLMPGSKMQRDTLSGTTARIDTNAIKALRPDRRAQDCAVIFAENGVEDGKLLCVYDRLGLWSAPWVLWLLASHGANVALIDGWSETGLLTTAQGSFVSKQDPSTMNAARADVLSALGTDTQIIDARGPGRFAGTDAEPRPECRSGHIPGSLNLPCKRLLQGDHYLELDGLSAIIRELGIDLERPIITTCGSGVTASILALAFHRLGARNVRVYQGSWAEWGSDGTLPIETGV